MRESKATNGEDDHVMELEWQGGGGERGGGRGRRGKIEGAKRMQERRGE